MQSKQRQDKTKKLAILINRGLQGGGKQCHIDKTLNHNSCNFNNYMNYLICGSCGCD